MPNEAAGGGRDEADRALVSGRVMTRLTRSLLSPLEQPECRSLFGAQLISGLGDWAGRLALAVLVFEKSNSAWWTAAVTVVSLLPWLGPGQMLSTLADRFGRITVMVIADLVRAALFLVMLAPLPVWALLALAFGAGLCVPPFVAARGAAMVDVVHPDRYGKALALFGVTSQAELVAGYAAGGALIALFDARTALAINAATFLISVLLLARLRGTAASERHSGASLGWVGVRAGAAVWRSDPICRRALVLFVGANMFMSLPEALVVPFADQISAPDSTVGLLAATIALGSMIAMSRSPEREDPDALLRVAATRTLVLALATAVGFLFAISWLAVIGAVALFLSGAVDAISVPTNQVVGERLPRQGRATAMSVAGGIQYGSQTVVISLGGALAVVVDPGAVLVAGALATAAIMAWSLLNPVAAVPENTIGAAPPRRRLGTKR